MKIIFQTLKDGTKLTLTLIFLLFFFTLFALAKNDYSNIQIWHQKEFRNYFGGTTILRIDDSVLPHKLYISSHGSGKFLTLQKDKLTKIDFLKHIHGISNFYINDINDDGISEIVAVSNNKIYIYSSIDFKLLKQSNSVNNHWNNITLNILDFDGDGVKDILLFCTEKNLTKTIYIFDSKKLTKKAQNNFPKNFKFYNKITDIYNDGYKEIILYDPNGIIYIVKGNKLNIAQTIKLKGNNIQIQSISDLNDDHIKEIIFTESNLSGDKSISIYNNKINQIVFSYCSPCISNVILEDVNNKRILFQSKIESNKDDNKIVLLDHTKQNIIQNLVINNSFTIKDIQFIDFDNSGEKFLSVLLSDRVIEDNSDFKKKYYIHFYDSKLNLIKKIDLPEEDYYKTPIFNDLNNDDYKEIILSSSTRTYIINLKNINIDNNYIKLSTEPLNKKNIPEIDIKVVTLISKNYIPKNTIMRNKPYNFTIKLKNISKKKYIGDFTWTAYLSTKNGGYGHGEKQNINISPNEVFYCRGTLYISEPKKLNSSEPMKLKFSADVLDDIPELNESNNNMEFNIYFK